MIPVVRDLEGLRMKVLKWIHKNAEAVICSVLMFIMMVLLFCQIILRELSLPLAWSEELAMFMMIWLCYFGVALAVVHRRHMKVDIVVSHFPKRLQLILEIVANLAFIVFSVIVVKQNWILMMKFFNGHQLAAATRIPKWIAYLGIPAAFALTAIRLVEDTVKRIKELADYGKDIKGVESK